MDTKILPSSCGSAPWRVCRRPHERPILHGPARGERWRGAARVRAACPDPAAPPAVARRGDTSPPDALPCSRGPPAPATLTLGVLPWLAPLGFPPRRNVQPPLHHGLL